jgi:hypothetical protein
MNIKYTAEIEKIEGIFMDFFPSTPDAAWYT